MGSVKIYEGQHYKEIQMHSVRRTHMSYECNHCEYTTRSKNWMIKHLAKKHNLPANK